MIEHALYTVILLCLTVLSIICLCLPYWAISTTSNSITVAGPIFYIGLWERCYGSPDQGVSDNTCNSYQISQSAFPTYFVYNRWACSIATAFFGLAGLVLIPANPKFFSEKMSPMSKFVLRILASLLLFSGSILSLVGTSWFCWCCYSDNLQEIIAPGTTLADGTGSTAYTPDWCTVIFIIVSAVLFVLSIILMIRACLIYSSVQQNLTNEEIYYRNKAMHELAEQNTRNRQETDPPLYYYQPDPAEEYARQQAIERAKKYAYDHRVYI